MISWNANNVPQDQLGDAVAELKGVGLVIPRDVKGNFFRHFYRERNQQADLLATRALKSRSTRIGVTPEAFSSDWKRIRATFDGGRRGCHAGAGVLLEGEVYRDVFDQPFWSQQVAVSMFLGDLSSTFAEAAAACRAVALASDMFKQRFPFFSTDEEIRVLLDIASSTL